MPGAKEKVEGNSFQSITRLIVLERLDREAFSTCLHLVRLNQIKWAELNIEYDCGRGCGAVGRAVASSHQRSAV